MQKINLIAQGVLELSHRENADDNNDNNDDDDTHQSATECTKKLYKGKTRYLRLLPKGGQDNASGAL